LELSVELGFGFYWVRASFFFSSDSALRNRRYTARNRRRVAH
jgi:hypothetical protein